MRIEVGSEDDILTGRVDGHVDIRTADRLRRAVDSLIGYGDRVIVDLGGVISIDPGALGTLIRLRQRALGSRSQVAFEGVGRAVFGLFERYGLFDAPATVMGSSLNRAGGR